MWPAAFYWGVHCCVGCLAQRTQGGEVEAMLNPPREAQALVCAALYRRTRLRWVAVLCSGRVDVPYPDGPEGFPRWSCPPFKGGGLGRPARPELVFGSRALAAHRGESTLGRRVKPFPACSDMSVRSGLGLRRSALRGAAAIRVRRYPAPRARGHQGQPLRRLVFQSMGGG